MNHCWAFVLSLVRVYKMNQGGYLDLQADVFIPVRLPCFDGNTDKLEPDRGLCRRWASA